MVDNPLTVSKCQIQYPQKSNYVIELVINRGLIH